MGRQSKLTPEQWAIAKARWEGSDNPGFQWLAHEVEDAWGHVVGRKSFEQAARVKGWERGGPQSDPIPKGIFPGNNPQDKPKSKGKIPPAADTPVATRKAKGIKVKGGSAVVPATTNEVASEVVDTPTEKQSSSRRPVGRPTKFDESFCEAIIDWFDKEPYSEKLFELPGGGTKLQMVATMVPMLAQFAKSIGSDLRTVNRWATDLAEEGKFRYPDFAEAYARAREMQEAMVAQGAMLGAYESRAAAFFLKNKHGWQDQPAQKVSVAAISREELDRTYGAVMEAARKQAIEVAQRKLKMLEAVDGGG